MQISDLLDQVVFDSGDSDADYRTAARRWLNFTRSYVADEGWWKSALDSRVTITTSAATTTGLYSLPDGYDFIYGDVLQDETTGSPVHHESTANIRSADPDKTTTGNPTYWTFAGTTAGGVKQILLWPIPDSTLTISFPAYRKLTDLTSAQDSATTDPFFGPVLPWGNCLSAGIRYYHDLNNNEDYGQVMVSEKAFNKAIRRRKSKDYLSLPAGLTLNIRRGVNLQATGRFDPAHYRNQ